LCTTLKNFVFECDDVPLEEQYNIAVDLAFDKIINRVVFSGSKSLHCRITLDNPPEVNEENAIEKYKFIWKELNKKYFSGKADVKCQNPSRLTRAPGGLRKLSGGTITLQILEWLSPEPFLLHFEWRDAYEASREKKRIYQTRFEARGLNDGNVNANAQAFEAGIVADGQRHELLPSAVGSWVAHRVPLSDVLRYVSNNLHNDNAGERKELLTYTEKLYKGEL
jgi:hypothetical protein